ncbi:MAG: AF1514 family protein [Deltaproteobacteria bacterium]|jgi:hypothetical protein|nr:AF1514 family protein [Deltaproteobacteria bacterium]
MEACEIPKGEMLPNPVYVLLDESGLDFERAHDAARNLAKKLYHEPMLLSWFDRSAERYSPQDVDCCVEGKPGWVEYARSRGGDFTVDINYQAYVFIFRGGEEIP